MSGRTGLLSAIPEEAAAVLVHPADLFRKLREWYSTPPRVHHTLDHVHEIFETFGVLRAGAANISIDDPVAFSAAVLFHDAVYDVGRKDNETKSADLALRHARLHFRGVDLERTCRLIAVTAMHPPPPLKFTQDEALIVDLDAAVLGADPTRYDRYAAGIRAEYEPVYGIEAYRSGRRAFLQSILDRQPGIFFTPAAQIALGVRAKENVSRELERL